jgi:hypothetical protein
MAWVRPSRSRDGQKVGFAGNSGGGGGSSLAGGGPTALGGGDTRLGRSRGGKAPRDQCHQPARIVTGPCCRMGFRWLLLRPTWKRRNVLLLGVSLADQAPRRTPKEILVGLSPGADAIDEQVSPGHGGDKAGVAGACGEWRAFACTLADAVGEGVGADSLAKAAMIGTLRLFQQPAGAVCLCAAAGKTH